MAQILVINEEFRWYQGIAALDNYYEIEIEKRILKHADEAFNNYYALKGKFTLKNRVGDTSDPDILLISKDFKKWLIVEVELAGKGLSHTRKQLRVFTDPVFVVEELIAYCLSQNAELAPHESQMRSMFQNTPFDVLVIFDSYHRDRLSTVKTEFPAVKVCVFEVYKTQNHVFDTYRLSGDYPYVNSGFTYLKPLSNNYDIHDIERPELLDGMVPGGIELIYNMGRIRASLLASKKETYIKIPRNPFPPGTLLVLSRTIDDKLTVSTVN